jgi:hypothetical protein
MIAEPLKFDLCYCLPISALGLSTRALNGLHSDDIHFVGELVEQSEKSLMRLANFGRKALAEVKAALESRGLRLDSVVVGRPEEYQEFLALLAQNERKALEEEVKRGAITTSLARDFKQATIIVDVIECYEDPRFRTELSVLVRKYKHRAIELC